MNIWSGVSAQVEGVKIYDKEIPVFKFDYLQGWRDYG